MLSRIGRAYARSMDKRPWSTQMVTCAGLFGAGDWCAQMLEFALNVTSPGKTTYNYKRTGRMITYGFFLGGPIYYGWYGVLLGEPPFPLMGSMLVLVGLVHEQPRPCVAEELRLISCLTSTLFLSQRHEISVRDARHGNQDHG